ncbi:MAG: serine acetyltransferase [Bacteroidales bacterium]|nr:serine acetyltransferase [Bacteroidales bacterium]
MDIDNQKTITDTIAQLSDIPQGIGNTAPDGTALPMPSTDNLKEIVDLCREIIFPGYFGQTPTSPESIKYHIGINVESLTRLLKQEIYSGLCFSDPEKHNNVATLRKAESTAVQFVAYLPELRRLLQGDVQALYNGDPASTSFSEIIFAYPAIKAISNYRIAHRLVELGVPLIPRVITEMAHSETGIDIHPGAQIGENFAIDHGTGVVIGATCIIGNNVKLYQGVTLGAKSFPLNDNGNPIKGVPRHPIIEDNVVIYAQATILGRITIGKNSTIGGNVWITENIPQNSKIVQKGAKNYI